MKSKVLSFLVVLAFSYGCIHEIDTDIRTYDCFYATVEEDDDATRAHFEQKLVKWDVQDKIGVFTNNQASPLEFTRNSSGAFTNSGGITGSTFYAFFPSTGTRNSTSSYYVTFSSPAAAFDQKSISMPMVANGNANSLTFKQTCGVLHFFIKGSGSYDKVSLKSNNGTYISGTGRVDVSSSTPSFSLTSNQSSTITATVPSGVNWNTGVDVYFVLPPMTLSKGFVLTVENSANNLQLTKSTSNSVTISRKKMIRYTLDLDELSMNATGHQAVDMGLSVLWASCNLGANKATEYGGLYAWGETSTKSSYTQSNYNKGSKYNNSDNKTVLELSDDAARVIWGEKWRMPTRAELDELLDDTKCEWTYLTIDNIHGFKVTSKITGKSIFLPNGGRKNGSSLSSQNSLGYYWTSSLYTLSGTDSAWDLLLSSTSTREWASRYIGQSIRPVMEQNIPVTGVSLDYSSNSISVGSVFTLKATVIPENASNKSVTWKSDNPNVATVDNNGSVTAVAVGNAIITVTTQDGNKTAQCSITVTAAVPEYVDLGLSVKWGTFNIGATKPGDPGTHFAWGEVSPKTYYAWDSYSLCNGTQSSIKKYTKTDGKNTLDASNDAAAYNLEGFWRMPTKIEMEELLSNCSWAWTSQDGSWGYRVTSKIPGYTNKSIFLPVTGRYNGSNKYGSSSDGKYWSSVLHPDWQESAYMMDFDENSHSVSYSDRYLGLAIRPVYVEMTSTVGQSVDLGLSVKWASWNVGANNPQDFGFYFAWGDPGIRFCFGWPKYKWCTVDNNLNFQGFTKYNTLSSKGLVDNKTNLDSSDDAARVLWGGNWRMPTKAELEELRTQCAWTWTSVGGVNGYRVKGKNNNNSIFLPAAGLIETGPNMGAGEQGYYWTSQMNASDPDYGYDIHFSSSQIGVGGCDRSYGLPIRPVRN